MKKIATALLVAALLPLPLQAQDTAENLVAGMRKAEMTYKECWRRLNLDPEGVRIKTWTGFMPQVQGSPGIR